jgi:hypothetical protein
MYQSLKEYFVKHELIAAAEVVASYQQQDIEQAITSVLAQGALSIVLLCCDADQGIDKSNINFSHYSQPIIGGVFPDVIWQEQSLKKGCLVIGLRVAVKYQINNKISNKINCNPSISPTNGDALLVFIDGLSSAIEPCIQALYDWVGNEFSVIGAGAGSLSLQQKPCIICNQGVYSDAMLVATIPSVLNVSIAHGWQQIAGPFLATSVEGNVIKEINYQPAFEIYKNNIYQQINIQVSEDNFFQHASSFPLGIDRLDDDVLIRDPIKLDGTDIVCVGAIPENSMLYLLTGNNKQLINSVSVAVHEADCSNDVIFVVDCVSRQLFLKQDFAQEIETIRNSTAPFNQFIAILGLGEIASGKYGAINFHNKTSVIGRLTSSKEAHCNT